MTPLAPPPTPQPAIHLGWVRGTKQPFFLPIDALTRGVHLRGAIGAGKTSVIRRLLVGRGLESPFVHFDYIGTGHRELQAWMATMAAARAVAESSCPELHGITAALLRRSAFLTIGDPNPAIRIDLLRRRMLPGGRREHLRDVVSRAVEILYVKLNDADASLRVRFHRIATAIITVLSAAERPIAEGLTLLDDPAYMPFLDREIAARQFRPSEITFLQHQRAELEHVLRLRPFDPAKSWRAFEDETASTRNSLADFAPGTVLGNLLNDESLALEDVVFGQTSLSITNREAEDQQKAKAYQAVHAMLHALALHRPDVPGLPNLLVVIDEPWWMRRNLPGILAVSRNLGVSYLVSHQSNAQWDDIGLRSMPKQLRSLTNLQITFRPTSFEDAEDDVLHTTEFAPDGFALRFASIGVGTSDGDFGCSSLDEHELVSAIGFSDQVRYRAQDVLRRARFTGVVTEDGEGTDIRFAPAPTFPPIVFGVPILDRFRKAHNAFWRAQTIPRKVYDPQAPIILVEDASAPPRLPAPIVASTTPSDHPTATERRAKPRRRRGRGGAPDAARSQRSRLHRDPVLAPLVLQPRDLAILRDAFLHRFASTPALLLSAYAASDGRGLQYACKRLSLLWRAGYIERFRGHHSLYLRGSEPFLYAIGSGKASAAARTGLPPHAISSAQWRTVLAEATPARERTRAALLAAGIAIAEIDRVLHNTTEILLKHYIGASSGVQHYVLTSDLVALLWFSARRHGWSVDDVQPDGIANLSTRDPEPHRHRILVTAQGILPIQPDCLFTIAGHRLAIEAETGSTSRAALSRKLLRYARRFEITADPTTRVLVHCGTDAHAELTLGVIASEIASAQRSRFLVSCASATSALLRTPDTAETMLTAPMFYSATVREPQQVSLFVR